MKKNCYKCQSGWCQEHNIADKKVFRHTPTPEEIIEHLKSYQLICAKEFEYICRAVSCHAELLAVCKKANEVLTGSNGPVKIALEHAITQAEGI